MGTEFSSGEAVLTQTLGDFLKHPCFDPLREWCEEHFPDHAEATMISVIRGWAAQRGDEIKQPRSEPVSQSDSHKGLLGIAVNHAVYNELADMDGLQDFSGQGFPRICGVSDCPGHRDSSRCSDG